MFPTGLPGVALLLFRLSIIAQLHLDAGGKFTVPSMNSAFLALEVLSISLAAGLYTPVTVVIGILGETVLWMNTVADRWPSSALIVVNLAILFLIGPGAYSVDARRYGRRVTILTKPR
jgi:hypothetical protein